MKEIYFLKPKVGGIWLFQNHFSNKDASGHGYNLTCAKLGGEAKKVNSIKMMNHEHESLPNQEKLVNLLNILKILEYTENDDCDTVVVSDIGTLRQSTAYRVKKQ